MIRRTSLTLIRLVLILAALCCAVAQNTAQTTNQSQAHAQKSGQSANKADLTPVPGKMRGMTNDMRRAVAARNADRKANQKKTLATTPQVGVKP